MTKKVFIAGGNGRVATELIKDLVRNNFDVVAGARSPEKIIKMNGVTPIKLDLHASVAEIATALGQDLAAIYFVAGSRGQDLLQTDALGAVKMMQAAKVNKIDRFIMLSSIFTLQPEKWHHINLPNHDDYNAAKFFADNYLVAQSGLDYTILQPTILTEESGTGRVSFDVDVEASNPIADVAATLTEILQHDNTIHQVIMMKSGDVPIKTAVANV
ncbi:NAD(P)H-binding protein [Levilactobacillus namurensis]|uniref:NAD(P)H-binding protein n=1 Tax=Levilactobacillus namurensis TaxID=380393 RepID=UPI0022305BAC|nr:NAD(P)H-binding protein [Levilactobacillus namurensis]MCW3779091.1 NAD(P)H-binding protein [Levilactobacillus namurensis]MDT7019925.1 NAD(P)H-binding protein [Levilactobacillus namurensis]WNN65495.1 NAD(P)H-binding protein [Levilactobacillus namurensis]